MSKPFSPLAIFSAILFLPCPCTAPAEAASFVTFVSGKGTDTGTCASATSPCRTFQFALGQTAPFGEVKALDPAEYGSMTITQSVSITGVEGASINRGTPGDAITINAGPNDVVNISHLILDGTGANAFSGIILNSGGSLTVAHCTVRNFAASSQGIGIFPASGTTTFLLHDVAVSNTSEGEGIQVADLATGAFDDVSTFNNFQAGIVIQLVSIPAAKTLGGKSSFANLFEGFLVGRVLGVLQQNGFQVFCPSPACPPPAKIAPATHTGAVWLYNSDASQNFNGVFVDMGAPAESAGNNFIHGNVTNVGGPGTLTGHPMKTFVPLFTPFRKEAIMLKFFSWRSAAASLFLACLCTAPANAASLVTYVSGKGTDTGTCASATSACRTFQFALGQTSPFGEVKALDPAEYGPMTITQSVTITGVEGASINHISGDEITISAGTSDVVNLSHLILDGLQGASRGIVLNSGGSLTIAHCTVRNFRAAAIKLQPASPLSFLVADTLASDNGANGISIIPTGTGSAKGGLNRVWLYHNGGGLSVAGAAGSGGSSVVAVESLAINNNGTGFSAGPNGVLRLSRSAAFGNGTGVFVASGVTAESAGTNFIRGNGTDISGTLTNVGTL
jgi:hypothetical protein